MTEIGQQGRLSTGNLPEEPCKVRLVRYRLSGNYRFDCGAISWRQALGFGGISDQGVVPSIDLAELVEGEAVYWYDSRTRDIIYSKGNRFFATLAGEVHAFSLPVSAGWRPLLATRLSRRLSRLDMANVVLNRDRSGLVVLYRGRLFFYDLETRRGQSTGALRLCRNVLRGGIAVTDSGIYFGEYGPNPRRLSVPVWRSTDDGRSWDIVYEFPAGSIKHVHGVYADPFTDRFWLSTGDSDGECFLVSADRDFRNVEYFGDGGQAWRLVSLIFEPEKILWGMDSQLATVRLQEFDRGTGALQSIGTFPGPVWYSKRLLDGWTVLQTTVEPGPQVASDHAHLFISRDCRRWTEIARFRKDFWKMPYFKFGALAFADGPQTSMEFAMFGEGLVGADGRCLVARLSAEPQHHLIPTAQVSAPHGGALLGPI